MISAVLSLALGASTPLFRREFVFTTDRADLHSVSLGGTFNSWGHSTTQLLPDSTRRRWTTTLELAPGRYQYKFVLNGTEWVTDPATKPVPDGNGNSNSEFLLLPPGYSAPARLGDGVITASGVYHDARRVGRDYDRGGLVLGLTTRAKDVQNVTAEIRRGGKSESVPMRSTGQDEVFTHLRLPLKWDRQGSLRYSFKLTDGNLTRRFGPKGLTVASDQGNEWILDPKTFKPFVVPTWVEDTIFYQIFPDRFDNGNKANDPKGTVAWDSEPTYWNWMGGDAAGIRQRLGYLQRLGVNGVYLNPVMDAVAYHRYDPTDFYKVCKYFGTNEEFSAMTREYEKGGVRVVLDQIFDHVGITFPPFVDLLKNQEKSKYKDWFFVKQWPVEVKRDPPYVAWFNAESMPKVNLAHPEVKKYLMESVDYWMKNASLSGWRLDVANEVPQWFWREFRTRVKKNNPDAWIVGEVWSDARMWLQGDQWDASMNYPFRFASLEFIAKDAISATEYMRRLFEAYDWYAPQVARNQLNLLSSHDTARFLTDAGNDRNLAKLAATVQMTWAGAPSIYYGEEIGMEGGHDPANRRGMDWKRATDSNEMLQHYRRLIKLRRDHAVLRRGTAVPLQCFDEQKVAAFGRSYEGKSAVILVNRSDRPQTVRVPLNDLGRVGRLKDALTGAQLRVSDAGVLEATVAPISAVVGLSTTAQSSSARRESASLSSSSFEGEKQ